MSATLKFGNGQWATKEGSTLAYNDENNNYKPLPFNFERDSVATRVNKQGLIETVGADQPRIDYLNDSNGALLLEPSRTNINPDGGVYNWTKSDASLSTEVQLISPSGNLESVGLVIPNSTGSSTFRGFNRVISGLTSGDLYQYSIFVKKKDARYCMFKLRNTSPIYNVAFDLDTKQIVGSSDISQGFSFEEYSNGWIRLVLGCDVASDGRIVMGIGCSQALPSGGNDFTGADGSSGMYCTFAQLEAGSYATSIIKTQGSAVTRLADVCNNGGNDQVINSTEGVLYAEINIPENIADNINISINDGTNDEYVKFLYLASTNTFRAQIQGSGNQVGVNTTSLVLGSYSKLAVSYKSGEFKLYINGSQIGDTLTGHTMPTGLDTLSFDRGDGAAPFQGNVKDVKVYNTTLNDSELQELTQV